MLQFFCVTVLIVLIFILLLWYFLLLSKITKIETSEEKYKEALPFVLATTPITLMILSVFLTIVLW